MKVPEGRLAKGWCGPASIRIAAGYLGMGVDEAALAAKIYDPEWGTSGEAMLEGIVMLGLHGMWVNSLSLDTLTKMVKLQNYQVILNWMDGENFKEDGHYGVLIDADKENVILADSEWIGSIKIVDRKKFEEIWFDLDEDGERQERYALVISR